MKNLEKLLLDLVDVGMCVKDVVNKSYFSALRKGIVLSGQLDGKRDWKACGEELLNMSNEDKAKLEASLESKLKVVQDPIVEKKIVQGFSLLCEAVEYAEQGVGVGKKLSGFIKGASPAPQMRDL